MQRIVSLVPSWTETLFAWPSVQVVGVTKWCVRPRDAGVRARVVGGTKNPDVQAIVDLAPDGVVANREENRAVDVEALEEAGLRVLVTDVRTVEEVPFAIRELAFFVGDEGDGEKSAEAVGAAIDRVRLEAAGKRVVPVYCPIWRRPWMSVGGDTFASSVLALVGARNVFEDRARYPEATPGEARAAGAEAVLLPSEPYPFAVKHVSEVVEAGFAEDRVRLLDGEALTWYGVRMLEGLDVVARVVDALRGGGAAAAGGAAGSAGAP